MKKILLIVAMAAMLVACGGGNGDKNSSNTLTLDDNGIETTTALTHGVFFDIPAAMMYGGETSTQTVTFLCVSNFDYIEALVQEQNGEEYEIPDDATFCALMLPKELFGKTIDVSKSTYEAQNRLPWSGTILFYNGGNDFGFDFDEADIDDDDVASGTIKTTRDGAKISIKLDLVMTDGRKVKASYSGTFHDAAALPDSNGTGSIKYNSTTKAIKWGGFMRNVDGYEPSNNHYIIYLSLEKLSLTDILGGVTPSEMVVIYIKDSALGQTLDVTDYENYMLAYNVSQPPISMLDFDSGTIKVSRTAGSDNFQIAVNFTATGKNLVIQWNGTFSDLSNAVVPFPAPRKPLSAMPTTTPHNFELPKLW